MVEFIIALADLFEAEARAMRYSLARLAGALALIAAAVVFVLAGLGLWLWSLYLYATRHLPPDAAALLAGSATLITAGAIAWMATRINR